MATFGAETTGQEVVEHFQDVVKGKTIVITGTSTKALGAETAISLAHGNPAALFLLARSIQKVQPVIDAIKAVNSEIEAVFIPVELDRFASIEAAAKEIGSRAPKIDILINSAGIMAVPYSKSEAGIEAQLATNHVGHFLLTNLLMEQLKAAENGARIVNLTSNGYQIAPFFFDDYNFSDGKTYHVWSGYGQSKTANILFTRHLAQKLAKDNIQSYAIHPGVIFTTNLSDGIEMSLFDQLPAVAIKNTGQSFDLDPSKSAAQGVSTTLVAALDPRLIRDSGAYLMDCHVTELREYASSQENADRLWKLTEKLVGREFSI